MTRKKPSKKAPKRARVYRELPLEEAMTAGVKSARIPRPAPEVYTSRGDFVVVGETKPRMGPAHLPGNPLDKALADLEKTVAERDAKTQPRPKTPRTPYSERFVKGLKDDVERLRDLYAKSAQGHQQALQEVSRLTNVTQGLKFEIDTKDAQIASLTNRVEALKEADLRMTEQMNRLIDKREDAVMAKQAAQSQRDGALERAERAEDHNLILQNEVSRLLSQGSADADEVQRLRAYLATLNEVGGRVTPGSKYEADAKAYAACAKFTEAMQHLERARTAFAAMQVPQVPAPKEKP